MNGKNAFDLLDILSEKIENQDQSPNPKIKKTSKNKSPPNIEIIGA